MTTEIIAPAAPTDDAPGTAAAKKRKLPQRGIRRRVLGDGEGDYCVYEIAPEGSKLPKGALLPLPLIPRFEDTNGALKWIRNESGDKLAGKQVMIFRACEILNLVVESKPTVVIQSKPKVTVTRPNAAERSEES